MKITVERQIKNMYGTFGELRINDEFECYTLEDPEREVKIKHETAIPKGRYLIKWTYSPKFKQYMPELKDVEGFTGIRIHAGNTVEDTSGCILVGTDMVGSRLLHSFNAKERLYKKIKEAVDRGEEIEIIIF